MKKIVVILIVALSSLFLSGCAGIVKSQVSVFHQLEDSPPPKTYVFLPLNGQENSLEYKAYIGLVRQQLSKFKYREAISGETPDLVIALGYSIDGGKEKLVSVPVFGQTGVSSSTTYGTLSAYGTYSGRTTYTPTYGIVGSSTVSSTEYNRSLWLHIVDAKSIGKKNLKVLYEANVKSSGSSSQLSSVMPAMIEALFKEFPGKSGKTRTETTAMK